MNSGRLFLVISLVALAAASLPGKLALAPGTVDDHGPTEAERRAADRLVDKGWVGAGVVNLTNNGIFRLQAFTSPRCQGALLLSAVAANGESDSMLAEAAEPDGTLFYVQGGQITEPPRLRAYVVSKFAPLLHRLGLAVNSHAGEVLAVIVTGDCQETAELPWGLPAQAAGLD